MSKPLALLLLLTGCGAPELEPVPVPSIVVDETPADVEVLPAGWFVHLYPAFCITVLRDADAKAQRCFNYYPEPCTPASLLGCSAIEVTP